MKDSQPLRSRRAITFLLGLTAAIAGCGLGMSVDEYLDRGIASFEEGDYRAAAIDARNVLEEQPDNYRARILLGESALELGDPATAEVELLRAIELGADKAAVALGVARVFVALARYQDLLDDIPPEVGRNASERSQILRLRGDALIGLGQSVEARAAFQDALREDDTNLDAMLGIVTAYMLDDMESQALETLDQVIAIDPGYVPARLKSGSLKFVHGDLDSASREFELARQLATKKGDKIGQIGALRALVETSLVQGDLDKASANLQVLRSIAPPDMAVRFLQGRLAYLQGDWSQAQSTLQSILQEDPEYRPAQLLLGAAHLNQGHLGQADMYLSAVLVSSPDNADARRLLAETRLRQDKTDAAADLLDPLIGENSTDSRALATAARMSLVAGNYNEATEYLRRRIRAEPDVVEYRLDLAAAYITSGDLDSARKILQSDLVVANENTYRRGLLLILALMRSGDFPKALEESNSMLVKWPDDTRLHNLVGGIQTSTGDYESARGHFNQALRLDPTDRIAIMSLGRVDIAEGRLDAARQRFEAVLARDPLDVGAMIALAQLAANSGDNESLQARLREAIAADPETVTARVMLARFHLANRDYPAALPLAAEAAQLSPDRAEPHNLQGLAQAGMGDLDNAVKSFERAIELDSKNRAYRLNAARAQLKSGRTTDAQVLLSSLEKENPQDLATAVRLAYLKAGTGDITSAIAMARNLADRYPDSEIPRVLLGELYFGNNSPARGADEYKAALDRKLSQDLVIRAYRLSRKYGRPNAEDPLLRFLNSEPENVAVLVTLGQHYQVTGRTEDAVRQYEKALSIDANDVIAVNNLAWAYFELGNSKAEELARRAVELSPDDGSAIDTLGWILVKKGDLNDGIALLRRANEISDGRPQVAFHLAVALSESGKPEEARKILSTVLSSDDEFPSRREAESLFANLR
ncbi:MAG: PEP-CTERM system TPR-repeat protein PrsT [Gammaproteobacteria bacterium]|nr:PEP-CTERM system TPR-repeat protein PrsT [Gammaproteobacteria bacterium]